MSKKVKTFISLLLCICMIVGTLPNSLIEAIAAETGTQQEEEGESVTAEVSGLGESVTEEDTEYLDQSVTVDISAAQVDGNGDALTTALTGETLTAVVSAYNDNPNYEAEATIRIYVEKVTSDSDSEIELKELPDIKVSGAGSSDKVSAVTVEAKWYAADDTANTTGIPYLEFSIPSGASAVFNLELSYPTGYDNSASAQIYAEVTTTDESDPDNIITKTTTYPTDSSDYLTFTWTGEVNWDNFTKTPSITAIGVVNSVIKADEVDWTFSADNTTTGSVGVVYTKYITMTDTLELPDGLSVSNGTVAYIPSSASGAVGTIKTANPSGKIVVGEVQNGSGEVVYVILLDDAYEKYYTFSMDLVTDSAGNQTGITYTITIDNPDETDVSFNPVSAISTSIYLSTLEVASGANLTGKEMMNTAELTVYSVIADGNNGYEVLYSEPKESKVTFSTAGELTVSKSVYQVKDGADNVTYGNGLVATTVKALSNEKKTDDGTPYVAQGYTVTYQVTVSNADTSSTDAEMVDTIPSQLTVDVSSIVVTSGNSTLVFNEDYEYIVSTDQTSGETTLTVNVYSVPANGSVVIQYSCKVGTVTAKDTITNTATVGNAESSAKVTVPENGDLVITREIVQRTTTTTTGLTLRIYKDLDANTYKCTSTGGDAIVAYFGTGSPTQSELEEAIKTVNAGDSIEYLITVDNQSIDNVTGIVYDSNLFSTAVSGDKNGDSDASSLITECVGGWEYYAIGATSALSSTADGTSSVNVSMTTLDDENSRSSLQGKCIYTYSNLENAISSTGIDTDYRGYKWDFSSSGLGAYTTYRQTTILQIPGENEVSSASDTNKDYQYLVSSYAFYCTSGYGDNYGKTTSMSWQDYVYFLQTGSTTSYTDCYGLIDHTVERQIYLNTGTLASTVVDSGDVMTDEGVLKELLDDGNSDALAANDYVNSARYFTADDNCYVVNYVYLFNDSSEAMYLDDYSVSVVLPKGFDWVGFTYSAGTETDGTSTYRTYAKVDSSSVALNNYYENENYDIWVNNTRTMGQNPTPYAYFNVSADASKLYYSGDGSFRETLSQMQQSASTNVANLTYCDSLTDDDLTCELASNDETTGEVTFKFTSVSNDEPTIAAYKGIVIMYVAKVSSASKVKELYTGTDEKNTNAAAATFQAYIKRVKNTKYNHSVTSTEYCMSQISPVIRVQDAASSSLSDYYRQRVSNDGNANTYLEHQLDYFYTDSSDTIAGGTAANQTATGDASRMWSYVSLSMYAEATSVSVTKEVYKNSGEEYEGQYPKGTYTSYAFFTAVSQNLGTLNQKGLVSGTGGYNADYDDYYWGYSLVDGIHRTVDGTVTWKTTVTNTGADTSGNNSTTTSAGVVYDYSTVDASTLLETIDSPYHLVEIAVPALKYYNEERSLTFPYIWLYYEIPELDPENPNTSTGWVYDTEEGCYYFETFPRTNNGGRNGIELTSVSDGNLTIAGGMAYAPCIRVTVRCLGKDTSLASGFDADEDNTGGNQNTCAYQYLIEFVDSISMGTLSYKLLLPTVDEVDSNSQLTNSLTLYLTFSTDDSIETNYNSFGLVLKDTLKEDVQAEAGELITADVVHVDSEMASASTSTGGGGGSAYNSSNKDSAGSVESNATVVQANDWTDTSYTDGMKTVTILDENDEPATDDDGDELSINSREGGNMVLPSTVEAGAKLHNTLMWESVLYESENYSSIINLEIYDTYGVSDGTSDDENVKSGGYDVDFSSITVTMCLDDDEEKNEASTTASSTDDFECKYELELGIDYDIYYTTEELVTKEHHPISVNTLELAAADRDVLQDESIWIKYDSDDPDATADALAFKIVFLEDGLAGTIWNYKYKANESKFSNPTELSYWALCEIYVDYDATVSDSVEAGGKYPNVMAWTADVVYPDGNTTKYIKEDTTAMFFKVSNVTYPKLTKTVKDESGNNISDQIPEEAEFTYLVFRTECTSHTSTNLKSADNITGVAAVTIHAGETLTLDDSNLTVLYNTYESGDDSAAIFWGAEDAYYYLVEMDSGNYTEESLTIAESTGVTEGNATSMKIGSLTDIATAILEAATILTNQAELCEAVAAYLKAGATPRTAYFMVPADTESWSVSVAGVNNYTAPALVIRKTDENGATIMNEVTFQMKDADGNTLCFTETSGGYAYAGIYDSTNTTGVTADLVFNGTTSVTGLPEGTYTLVETAAPEGYEISTAETTFTIAAERDKNGELVTKVEKSVANKTSSTTVTGSVKLVKVDDSTNKAITTDSASFELYSSKTDEGSKIAFTQDEENGTEVAGSYTYDSSGENTTISTDASTGTLNLSGLPLGTYYLVETHAPEGYESDYTTLATAYEITISRTELEVELDFPNTYIQADIVITKTDENGDAITGNPASFTLTDASGNDVTFTYSSDGTYTYDKSGSVTTLATSSKDGKLTLQDLPKGTYTLTETNAPKGYTISTDPVEITVSSSGTKTVDVENETASMRLRIAKTWKYEGRTATYAFSGVNFTLYQVSSDGMSASEAASGTTNGSGILDLDDLDWSQKYYLYEEVPTGFATSGTVTVYLDDTTGEIDLTVTEAATGYTAISCIYIDMASTLNSTNSSGEEYCTYTGGSWTYTLDVLNVKNGTYGGKYASTAYKTISNAKSAAAHEGLEEQTGYSYFYQQSDYDAGNYNYVNAIQNGDTVTYTLNISNVSETEFTGLVIIDRMPETGDTGVVNSSALRGSEFAVVNPANIAVTVDGVEVSSGLYTISYSTKVKFTNSDFNGTSSWTAAASDSKSFRIVFDSTFTLDPGQTLVVTYDGVIGEDAEIDEIAWNNFAYRYTASSGSKTITLTPEPPKVGVLIQGESYKVTKEWEDDDNSQGLRPSSVTLQLKKKDSSGNLTEVENGTVTLTYAVDTSGMEPTESLTATIAGKTSGSTVEVEASLDEDGNWICLWTGLPILKDGYSYVVEEIDTGSTNYVVGSVAMEKDENGVENEESAIVTNKLTFTTLNLVKQDSDGGLLSGTQFSLERQTDTNTWETVDSVYTIDSNGKITTTSLTSDMLTTGDDGKITITGLQAGTYRITEVKSKSGYTLLSDPLVIELPVSYTDDEVTSKKIDTNGSDTYQTGDNWYFYNVTYTITNTANFTMPSAGQTADSVWISGFFGALLLAGAWMFLLHRRRANHLINHLPDTP